MPLSLLVPVLFTFAQTPSPSRQPPDRISVVDLKPLHAAGEVLVIDVRTKATFDAGHIAGAMSVPLEQIGGRVDLDEIRKRSRGRLIVTYCSCPTEHASLAAAETLRAAGLTRVAALTGGYLAWKAAGGDVKEANTM